jgi:uncharacterized membrane protein YsdA (DUF1294 family)/cold shock CspA family protein
MRLDGLLKTWNDERGFGFIQPANGGQEIFVHIKSFPAGYGRPALNLKITFEVEKTAEGKKQAKNVLLLRPNGATAKAKGKPTGQWGKASIFALAFFALLYLVVTLTWGTPVLLAIGYVVMSLTCGLFYAHDKAAAQENEWRTPEGTLLMLGLVGGWPGAIVAQQMLRHKTSKVSFRVAFWLTVLVNVGAFIVFTTPLLRSVPV